VCAKWDKLYISGFGQLTNKISTNIDVSRKLSADWIFAHGDACQVVIREIMLFIGKPMRRSIMISNGDACQVVIKYISFCGLLVYKITECLA